jgi:hypothetical protein
VIRIVMFGFGLSLAACGGTDPASCIGAACATDAANHRDGPDDLDAVKPDCSPVIGDLSLPIEIIPIDATLTDIAEGAAIMLDVPIQGGIVIYAGARARNLDGCNARVIAALRDLDSHQVIGLEERPTILRTDSGGWGAPVGAPQYALANIAVCPNVTGTHDLFATPWQLEVRIETADHRSATITRTVTPMCGPPNGFVDCPCECAAGWQPGQCDGPDGGSPPDAVDAGS